MAKFIVSMKHYDDFSGLIKDSVTVKDFETAKRVFEKWVENDKNEWNPNCYEGLTIKETAKTYMATLYRDFGLEYTKITIRPKRTANITYAIIHHSETTNIRLCFVAKDSAILLSNEKLINNFVQSENKTDFITSGRLLENLGIKFYNSTMDELPQGIETLKEYNYKF